MTPALEFQNVMTLDSYMRLMQTLFAPEKRIEERGQESEDRLSACTTHASGFICAACVPRTMSALDTMGDGQRLT